MSIKKRGFTLAEVLITLGIIGIVSALTIPGLMSKYKKIRTATQLKKAISVINQAYKRSFDDVGEPADAFKLGSEEYFKTYWAPYIKALTDCNTYQECGYDSIAPFKYLNNTQARVNVVSKSARTTFYTADGILYIIFTAQSSSTGGRVENNDVYIDLNGGNKPNVFGKDVFILTRIRDGGGVQPLGYNLSNTIINKNCSENDLGTYCAERIKRASWTLDSGYPWK